MHRQYQRLSRHQRNRRKTGARVELQILVGGIQQRQRVGSSNQRIAVGNRFGHSGKGDGAGGAGPVVDNHLLSQFCGQLLGDDA